MSAVSRYGNYAALHSAVAAADPLRAKQVVAQLPELNRTRDVHRIVQRLRGLLPALGAVRSASFADAAAMMRDIGFFLGSLKRHGHEPTELVPELVPILLELARVTDLPPRETLLHVTVWNPSGTDQRSYTGLTEELHLLESVRSSTSSLESAIAALAELYDTSIYSQDFCNICGHVVTHLTKMVESVVYAHRTVPPQVFAAELRPFYETIVVDGRPYLGPGAVEMPLFVFDHVLWGANVPNAEYAEFRTTYLPYVLAPFRELYSKHAGRPSLLECVTAAVRIHDGPPQAVDRAIDALERVFDCLLRFRLPHLRLAEKAYDPEAAAAASVGSGGYAPDMLAVLATLTRAAREQLGALKQRHAVNSSCAV